MKKTDMQKYSIVLAGTGNVAFHLGQALYNAGHTISQIYGRNEKRSHELASYFKTSFTVNSKEISNDADVYILAVNDEAIDKVKLLIPVDDSLVIHTSGSTNIESLTKRFKNSGVLYPLQTLSKDVPVDFKNIPVLIEGNNEHSQKILRNLADSISGRVEKVSSDQRLRLHIAAVFACNFTNHFFTIAFELMKEKGLSPDLLKPLISETFRKIETKTPFEVQTGPAIRGDLITIEKHLRELEGYFNYQNLYTFVSDSILKKHKNDPE